MIPDYEAMKKVLAIGGIGCFLLFSMYWQYYRPSRMEEYVESIEDGRETWDTAKVDNAIQTFNRSVPEAIRLLERKEYEKATKLYRDQVAAVEPLYYRRIKIPSIQTLDISEWYEERTEEFEEAWKAAVSGMLDDFAEGKMGGYELERLTGLHSSRKGGDRQMRYDRREALDLQRAKLAVNWVRVTFNNSHRFKEHFPEFEKAFRSRWNDSFGYQLVFGEPIGNAERAATWRHITVDVDIKTARYEIRGGSENRQFYGADIPEQCVISYKSQGDTTIPSTWDDPKSVTINVDVPQTLSVDNYGHSDEAQKWKARVDGIIADRLIETFGTFPEFALFPGVDPATLALLNDRKRIDFTAARALALLNRARLVKELKALSDTDDPALEADIVRVSIEMNLSELSDVVTGMLQQAEARLRKESMNMLKVKPWYGEYSPLLALMDSGDRQCVYDGLHALRGHMAEHPELIPILEERAADRARDMRDQFAVLLLKEVDDSKLASYGHWLQDADARFAGQVMSAFFHRDRDLFMRLVVKRYDRVNPEIQADLIKRLVYEPDGIGEAGLNLLIRAARSEKEDLSSAAVRVLQRSARYPAAWDAYRDLDIADWREHDVYKYHDTLIQNVSTAHPAKAQSWLLEKLIELQNLVEGDRLFKSEDEEIDPRKRNMTQGLRDQCVYRLMYVPAPWHETVMRLNTLVKDWPEDQSLRKVAMDGLSQRYRDRDWDHTQPAFIDLLRAGTLCEDKRARLNAYRMLEYGVGKGMTTNAGILQDALDAEEDAGTRATLVNILSEIE